MNSTFLSLRARNTPSSPIRRLAYLAAAARAAGTTVHHLNIGQPDLESPKEFFEGISLYQEKVLAYETSKGNERLCAAWSSYMNKTLDLATTSDDFLITMGASEALIFVFMTCCDPGDEVIVFDPTYANYIGFAAISGVTLRPLPCSLEENFKLPEKDVILNAVNPRTKAILLCSPNNPTGTVYSREELSLLRDICEEKEIFLIVDETYREFVYDGGSPLSILHIAPKDDRVIVIDSLSKRFSLCGARVGCLITTNRQVLETALHLAQARLAGPTIEQIAASYMLETISPAFVEGCRNQYEERRGAMFTAFSQVEGVTLHKPGGAFYALVRLPVEDAEDFCKFMLTQVRKDGCTTFLAPGAGFYIGEGEGRDIVRVAYVLKSEDISQAISAVDFGLQRYKSKGS